jgi:DNA mismatch endonuclease (patch repair protein)
MDKLDEEQKRRQRSYNMSRIRSKDTKPERVVRHWLFVHGYRYRKNVRKLPGSPDIVMRKYSVCIFIHGCFWHGHEHIRFPQTNAEFWHNKIMRNKDRDARNKQQLMSMGWNIITVWECQLKSNMLEKTMNEVEYWINRSLLIKAGDDQCEHFELSSEQSERHASIYDIHEQNLDIAAEEMPDGYKK